MIELQAIVDKANALRKTLDTDFRKVKALVNDHDLVFAVWQESSKPDGVATMIIKGEHALREIVASQKPQPMKWTAIPCISAEQAEALRQVAGEPRALN